MLRLRLKAKHSSKTKIPKHFTRGKTLPIAFYLGTHRFVGLYGEKQEIVYWILR